MKKLLTKIACSLDVRVVCKYVGHSRFVTAVTLTEPGVAMKSRSLLCLVGLALALTLSACGGSSGGGSSSDEIKLGVILSSTGPYSSIGVSEAEGAKAAAKAINAAGGVDGKKIKLVFEDAQSTPQAAAAAATKLIQNDKVAGLVGPEATALALAVAPIAQAQHIPLVSTSSSFLGALQPKDLPYSFAASPSTAKIFAPMLKYWAQQGITKIGVIGPKGDVFDGINAALKGMPGIEVVGAEQFEPGQADVTASMTKLAGDKPQAIVVAGAAADGAAAQKAWHTLAIDSVIVQIGSNSNQAFIDLAGEDSFTDKTVFAAFPSTVHDSLPADNPSKAAADDFVKVMTAGDSSFDPGSLAVLSWNAVYAFRDAINAASSNDSTKIRDALESTKMTNPLGEWQRSSKDHDGSVSPFVIATHDSSGWKYVTN
jgi:branched-chain amino acid transport system substrate-binding protein